MPWPEAAQAIGKGSDVYLFLVGMMLLSAMAEREGLFDHLAAACVARARGSAGSLFLLVYALGTAVTVLMSNDATAVVLTPAVLAVARKAEAKPLPYMLACALIANAASFVLPISNPANLVVFGDTLPALGAWIGRFRFLAALDRRHLRRPAVAVASRTGRADRADAEVPALSPAGRLAAGGIA